MHRISIEIPVPKPADEQMAPAVLNDLAVIGYLGWMMTEGFYPANPELRPTFQEVLRDGVAVTSRYLCRIQAKTEGGRLDAKGTFEFPEAVYQLVVDLHGQVVAAGIGEPDELQIGRAIVEQMIVKGVMGVVRVEL